MRSLKQINIKNRTYYFYNDIIDIETFDSNMLKLDKRSYKNLGIYNIGYVTVKKIGSGYDINSLNPLYLRIGNANWYIEEINEEKYLVFDDPDEDKELKYEDVFNEVMSKIKEIDDDWLEYSKDYTKIKFSSDDNLPLNKLLQFYNMTVTIRCVFSEDNDLYPQAFLDDALYKSYKCWNMIELIFQKELMLIKQINQENVSFVITGIS